MCAGRDGPTDGRFAGAAFGVANEAVFGVAVRSLDAPVVQSEASAVSGNSKVVRSENACSSNRRNC